MPVWRVPRGCDPGEILNQENMDFSQFTHAHLKQMNAVRELVTNSRPLCEDCGEPINLEDLREHEGKDWHFVCVRRMWDKVDQDIDNAKMKR